MISGENDYSNWKGSKGIDLITKKPLKIIMRSLYLKNL